LEGGPAQSSTVVRIQEFNPTGDYRITEGVLQNFWLRIRYAHNVSNISVPIEDFRVILNYTVNFEP